MKRMVRPVFQASINDIITERLTFQSTKFDLDKSFGISLAGNKGIEFLKDERFKALYSSWNEDKKKDFVKLIGGVVNFAAARKFIEEQ